MLLQKEAVEPCKNYWLYKVHYLSYKSEEWTLLYKTQYSIPFVWTKVSQNTYNCLLSSVQLLTHMFLFAKTAILILGCQSDLSTYIMTCWNQNTQTCELNYRHRNVCEFLSYFYNVLWYFNKFNSHLVIQGLLCINIH